MRAERTTDTAVRYDARTSQTMQRDAMECALLEERAENKRLREELELFKSSFDVFEREQASQRALRTQVSVLEEEVRLRTKEISALRRENGALLKKDEARIAMRVAAYEEQNRQLTRALEELNARKDAKVEDVVKAYEKRIALLEEHLDTLSGGQWSMVRDEKGEASKEITAILENIKRQRDESDQIAKRIAVLEKAYAAQDLSSQVSQDTPDRERSDLYFKLGQAYVRSQEYDKAVEAFLACERYGAAPAETHYYLGLLYQFGVGDREKALGALRKYLFIEPNGRFAAKADRMVVAIGADR
jgi:tetratricopeptide (TPR) repeat protein